MGAIPDISYFSDITSNDYQNYLLQFTSSWSLRCETIKYCELDCKILYDILKKFNYLIFSKYLINIHRCPSLPSLAFTIYRAKYLKDAKIPLISGNIYEDIRKSYTGGAVDVYKANGKNLFTYDVNSLYPFVMLTKNVPVGNINFFEGDITKLKPWSELFGFFKVKVTAPDNLEHPIIQTKLRVGKAGVRTVAPLGTWTEWLFTEEIINAMNHGYKFEIIKGYTFDQANIFEEYVKDLYEIKVSHSKSDPMYLVAKLLLNSLYGRFGMSNDMEHHVLIANKRMDEFLNKYCISDVIPLNNAKSLISYSDEQELETIMSENSTKANISVSIASAITAYARIHMSQFKNTPDYDLFYSDTDSIVTNKPLPDAKVGKAIGLMKLENNLSEGVFLAPKVYGGILADGTKFTKVKGYKNNVNYSDLKTLLNEDVKALELHHEKWFRSFEDGKITIKDQLYSLQVTENKRRLIYSNKKLLGTQPFIINNDKEII